MYPHLRWRLRLSAQGLYSNRKVKLFTSCRARGNTPGDSTGQRKLKRAFVSMGCVWDADAPHVHIPRRVTRLIVVHRALSKWAGERGVKEPSPPWTSPRVKPPMPQCATPRRLRFAEDSLCTIPQTSHIEQPAFCARQPPNDQLVEKRPTESMETKACLAGSRDTEPADAASGPA